MAKILVVDDEQVLVKGIKFNLESEGYQVEVGYDGQQAVDLARGGAFDLILLDIMMGGISGLEVCRRVRDKVTCPILFLSAKDTGADIVRGLGLGADDYLTKPFELEVLAAKVHAHLRRQSRSTAGPTRRGAIQIGDIRLDMEAMAVTCAGKPVALSTRELELLTYLMTHAGQTLSRERIFREVWQSEYGDISTVAINIKNLRSKLDPEWRYIKTIWGSGYCFVTQSAWSEGEDVRHGE